MSQKKRIGWLFLLCATTIFLLSPQSYAGIEFEEWHPLPQIKNIVFSNTSVGFISQDHRYFVIDRKSNVFQQVNENSFHEKFHGPLPAKPYEKFKEREMLRASNGMEFQSESAYCDEGAYQPHKLWLDGKAFQDVVAPCVSISAVEIIDNQLWLGTYYMGEGGEAPAHGIIVQSLQELRLIKKIDTNEGLTGNLVRAIRTDTQGDKVWAATERGLNEVNLKLQVVASHYFYEDFDSVSGKPTVFLSSSPKSSNPFAVISRVLSIQDSKAFYEAVKLIPQTLHNKLNLYYFFMYSSTPYPDFLPSEMNVLIPFFIEAAQSHQKEVRRFAFSNLCKFKDKRIYDFMINIEKSDPAEAMSVRDCLTTYAERGLIEKEQVSQRIKILVERMQNCIISLRQSDSLPSCYSSIVEDAKSLKAMGSDQGMHIMNEYFQTSQWNLLYSQFYDSVFSRLYYEDELIPAAMEGLKKIPTDPVYRGCMFFNTRHNKSKKRYSAKFAEAILLVIERAVNPTTVQRVDPYNPSIIIMAPGAGSYVAKQCIEALESQLGNDKVKEEFIREVYPRLSDNQKKLADKIILKKRD